VFQKDSRPTGAGHFGRHHDPSGAADFASTQWSLVLAAGNRGEANSLTALEELCRRYWVPLYAYARRRIRDVHQAQDAVQEFFSHLLEKNTIAVAKQQRGRFRSFLLTAFRNFLTNEHAKLQAQKRGGGQPVLSLDFSLGESRFQPEPSHHVTAEKIYDRQWTVALLQSVLDQLRETMTRAGKEKQFETLAPFLAGNVGEGAYAEASRRLGITEGAAMVAAHRLRTRYRKVLRAEIAQTLTDPADVDDEIRRLFASLSD
jgi:RNA polymerase sigma-70 factor (ECF subfamily)